MLGPWIKVNWKWSKRTQNIDILGIGILKWTGMGEFNSDDHYIYYCGQESLRRNGVAIISNKSLKCSTWIQSQKRQNDLCLFPSKPFNITVIQTYAPASNTEVAEVERFCEDLQDLLELTSKKDVLFIIGDWNAKVESQETPGITGKFGLGTWNEAGQRLVEFCQENAVVIVNTSSSNTREDSTHGHHQMVNTNVRLTIFFAAKDGEALYSQQKQDWELTVAQIMNSLLPNSDLNWRK